MMNVIYVVVITPVVQIVQAHQMVMQKKICVALVIVMLPMTVCRIVLVHGVEI